MKTDVMYARNEETAQNYMEEYVKDHTQIHESSCNCPCGESKCYNIYNGSDKLPETRVIICESCYETVSNNEKV